MRDENRPDTAVRRRLRRVPVAMSALVCVCGLSVGAAFIASTASAGADRYYLSLGDSYASGQQPEVDGRPAGPGRGFPDQLVDRYRAGIDRPRLVNLGCTGITAGGLVDEPGCAPGARAVGGPGYDGGSQLAAALTFLREHPGKVDLITVVVGGNDVIDCLIAASEACAAGRMPALGAHLSRLLSEVRAVVGPEVTIVGLTYPDSLLGAWVYARPGEDGPAIAATSVAIFRDHVNPTLRAAYARAGARFVDVTAAGGAYRPLTETVGTTYGTVPVPVARACALTYYCRLGDPHPTAEGQRLIVDELLRALPTPRRESR